MEINEITYKELLVRETFLNINLLSSPTCLSASPQHLTLFGDLTQISGDWLRWARPPSASFPHSEVEISGFQETGILKCAAVFPFPLGAQKFG